AAVETLEDVSDIKRKEGELLSSEEKLQGIVRGSPIPQFVLDKTHRVISWNHALEEYSGIHADEILGTPDPWKAFYSEKRPVLADLILDNTPDEIARWYSGKYSLSRYVEGAFEAPDFFPQMGPDGKWLFFTASAIRDREGTIIGAVETLEDVTDIKNKEEALRASEEDYRRILNDLQDVYYRSDKDGNLVMMSPSGFRLLGSTPDQLIGRSIAAETYYHPEQRQEFLAALKKQGFVTGMEVVLKRADGTPVPVSTSSHMYYDKNGNFLGVEGTFHDISGARQADEALRQSAERYRSLFEATGTAMLLLEESTTIGLANAEFYRMSGYTREEVEGKMSWTTLVVKEDLDRMLAQHKLRRENRDAALRHYEFRFITKSGGIRHMFLTIDIIPGTKQSVASLMDITEKVQAQRSLRQSEERYRALFETTGTAVVLIEADTIISLANAEFYRMSGYTPPEIERRMSWTTLVVKEDLDRMLAQHKLRRENHQSALRNYEFRFVTKSGEIRNIFVTIDVIPGTGQSVASLLDFTEKVRAQEALKLANHKLNLLYSITRHDILNQLTSLFGFLELAKKKVTDPALLMYLEREKKAAESIRSHIEFTRDYQDVGVRIPEWQRVSDVIAHAGESLNLKGVTLSVDVGMVEVYADLLLQKVFYTLIDNSLRHGGRVARIRFTAESRPGSLVIICEDDGVGVPDEVKEKIFQRQYFKNTGLGLFLSQEILSITGLTLKETGLAGKGARFEIHIPRQAFRYPDDGVESTT
ncbi:MAG: PAS domain-containing sensor histidine kinase, partial [Methanomicrobiales archaeon]|nr:PAS domain-containing sensor histidine kinase [Methanomicrobiales archaeon]